MILQSYRHRIHMITCPNRRSPNRRRLRILRSADRECDLLILTLGFSPNIGGLETFLEDFLQFIEPRSIQAVVATLQPFTTPVRAPHWEISGNIEIRRQRWFGNGLFHRVARTPLIAFLYAFPALVLATIPFIFRRPRTIFAQGLVAGAVARVMYPHRRLVIALHSDLSFGAGPAAAVLHRILIGNAAVLCLSERVREQAIRLGAPKETTQSFRYWVDLTRFRPHNRSMARQTLQLAEGFVVLFVGRLIPEKGTAPALAAAEQLAADDVQVLFVGEGPEAQHVLACRDRSPSVIYRGTLTQEDLPIAYSSADVLLVPSISEEGFGRVIIESLACGTPVIGARRGGIPEALSPEVGILIEPTTQEIVRAVQALRNDPTRLECMARNARPFAEERYSERNAEILVRALFDCTDEESTF